MKKSIVYGYLIFVLFLGCFVHLTSNKAYAVETVEIIADDHYPPFVYRQGFQSVGLYVQILQAVFQRMPDYEVLIKPMPWKRGLNLMKAGAGFAIFPPYYFPDKRPFLTQYSVPLLEEKIAIFCSKHYLQKLKHSSEHELKWPKDFAGAKIGINPGFLLLGESFWALHYQGFYQIQEGLSNQKNILKVLNGRIDCLANSRMSVFWDLQQLIKKEKLVGAKELVEVEVIQVQKGFLAFSEDKLHNYPYKQDFIKQFNKAFLALKNTGELDMILQQFETNLLSALSIKPDDS